MIAAPEVQLKAEQPESGPGVNVRHRHAADSLE
jgi:hypothetical protein